MSPEDRADSWTGGPALPLTGPQLGIWNAQRFDPESGRYLVGEVLEISGAQPVDTELLAEAIRRTVAEAENMRLRFRETDAGPRQFVADVAARLGPEIDLRAAADPVSLAHEAVAVERHRAAEHCRGMVDRQLYSYTLIRVTDSEVWCVQLYHHLIVDGYSAALLSRRVAAHYTALRRGNNPPKRTFGTIAALIAEEQAYRTGPDFERDRAYWRETLTPWPDLDGRGRHVGGPVERTLRAESILSTETLTALRESADRHNVSWADILLSCYAAFLSRHLGTSDLVISMLLMGRVGRAALTTPAMAVNVLPLRLTVRPGDRLADLAPRVADTLREIRTHQRYSGDDLARDFHGHGAGELLHGIGINLKVFDFALDFDGSRGVLRNVAGGPPEDLGLTVTPLPDGTLLLGFESDARNNTAAAVRARINGLARVINAFTGSHKPPVGALHLIDPHARAELLAARAERSGPWPTDPPSPPQPHSAATDVVPVPELFDRLTKVHPDAIVLADAEGEWSARTAGQRVHRLARYLRSRGVGPEVIVGIALPRGAEFVMALFAVWQAGGVALPLDSEHPVARLSAMVDDAAPAIVLAAGELSAIFGASAVVVDPTAYPATPEGFSAESWPAADAVTAPPGKVEDAAAQSGVAGLAQVPANAESGVSTARPGSVAGPANPVAMATPVRPRQGAYLIYTSGSTGRPKGVLVDHGALAQLVAGNRSGMYARAAAGSDGRLRVAHTTSFAFDAALDPLFWLLDGHRVQVYDSDIRRDPARLVTAFERDGIDVADGTPVLAAALLDHGLDRVGLRLLALGGDACSPELWRRIQDAGIAAVNLYGPTESTVDAVGAVVDGAGPRIGYPLPGTRVYLLDSGLQAVADHRIGELYLAGPQLARGYLGRPGGTAERFVADPFGPPGARMYRTGDRARWVPGRGYEYAGRVDAQVKIRGHRVELGEVEAALGGLPRVRGAAADIRQIAGRPTLIGYVVTHENAAAASFSVDLRSALAERVPDHMVPARIVVLEALPHTVNGKLDRAALPDPPADGGGRAPETPAEQALCTVVGAVLGHEAVSVDDDFFGAGGDSITAITVSSRLREQGFVLTPLQLLSRAGFAALAAAAERSAGVAAELTARGAATPERARVALTAPESAALSERYGAIADVLPLSPLQEGLLFHALRDGADDIYTLTAQFELHGPVDAERLGAAFAQVLARYPNLGAAFSYAELDDPVQVLPQRPRTAWRVVDLRDRTAAGRATEARELAERAAAEPFDIAEPPLLRGLLIRLSEESQRFVLTAHHLLADGWSIPIVMRELLALYHGATLSKPAYYGDYLVWLAARDADATLARWREHLDGLSAGSLVGTLGGRSTAVGQRIPLPDRMSEDLEAAGRRHGLTMNILVQGAWALALAAHLDRTDVVFGAVVSGRPADLPEVENMVGLFSNTIPVRLRLDRERPLLDQLVEFQRETFELQGRAHLGLATIERALGLGSLFDSLVVFENFPKSALRQPDSHELRVADVTVHSLTHFPVTVTARPGARFELMLHHDPAAVPVAAAARLAERLGAVLTGLVTEPAASAGTWLDATNIEAAHRERCGRTLAEWGSTVAVDPDAPAVTAEDTTISYREFDSRANRLARRLIARGIGPESVVAVAMPRTLDAVIAAHAVIRSGGVYLPIDPEQPARRIEKILETARPALVLESLEEWAAADFDDAPVTDADRIAPLHPGNSAYLLFTSGSTGIPKGVTVPHEAIVNTFEWLQHEQRFGPGDTVLYRTPPTFDASLLELFLPLHVGARIVLTRPDGHRDPYYQARLIRDERVTAIQMTTSMLTVLAEEADLAACTDLRCVITGGEALPPGTAQRVRALTGARVHNLYGPTEAAVCITRHETDDTDTRVVPIGRPAPGSGVHVLDEKLHPVPSGVIGELYLTGAQLARGYLSAPGATAASFIPDPNGTGTRMYRTGDLVKWTARGELEYVGRADSQVKLRGQRIELGDIESALLNCPGVAQAVVLLREDTPGDQRLVAYLITPSGLATDTAAVRSEVRKLLPAYMVPSAFVILDHIPRTGSEKVDRKALPAPDLAGPDAKSAERTGRLGTEAVVGRNDAYTAVQVARARRSDRVRPEAVAAVAEVSAAIAAAMAAVLSVPAVATDEDFFTAGGHSLTAVRLVGRLRRAGMEVVLDDVFEARTPHALATRIAGATATSGLFGRRLDHVLPLRAEGAGAPLFCVHPIGGTAWQFGPLARLLRADRPVIGLQLPSLGDRDFHAADLGELARHYLATVRGIQPRGPYHLLGYSLGGNIVHELAAALESDGETIAFIGLIDSHPLANLTDQATKALADPAALDRLLPEIDGDTTELAGLLRSAATDLLRMVTNSAPPRYSGRMALYAADTALISNDGSGRERTEAQLSGWVADHARLVVRRLPYTHFDIVSERGWTELAALLDADPALGL
ncbi:amino acid adenylation domain-containing protein [Nocardia inohanensis]|uniref:amino acid adenylation domain-containing protein n=1 Tax=Nocardia inohanensis TaxID=209246 RepID=UPI00082E2712|nr:non-ribosomal peptide synthetase [Nocardia inohanensis]